MRRKLRQRQIPSFGRRMVRVCRETDFSGCCFARKYDCMGMPGKASLCHPCRQPSAPACGVPRRRNGSRAQRRQREVWRECRNDAGKGRFGGNVETRISPAVVSPGNTTAWGRRKKTSLCHPCRQPSAPACGMPRRRNGSRAQRRQREVWRECRNEDFSGCYFARKYNCMGTPKKKPPFVKGRFGGNVETRISPAVTSLGNTTAWGRRRNPTARGSCSPRSGGKAP